MSIRVHELAKELGLKSQELIDRIQKSGLDVKPSPLASLEPGVVERIKSLVQSPGAAPARPAVSKATAPEPPPTRAASTTSETPPISAPISPPARPATPATAEAKAPAARPDAPAPGRPAAAIDPAPAPPPRATAPPPATPAARPATSPSAPLSGHSRSSALTGMPRASGPLSGHTPHRTTPGGAPPAQPRPGGGGAPPGQADLRPNPVAQAPLRREDYISPTGQRRGSNIGAPSPTSPPPLRRTPPAGGEGPRREGGPAAAQNRPGRALPPVAAPPTTAIPPNRPSGPRPSEAAPSAQRPAKRFTPEELRKMVLSGQIGGAGQARPSGPQARGPQQGPGVKRQPGATGTFTPLAPISTGIDDDERKGAKGGPGRGAPGGIGDRAGRRAKRTERANERKAAISSPLPVSALTADDDDTRRRGPRRQRGSSRVAVAQVRRTHAVIEPPITVRTLSEALGVKGTDLIRKMVNLGHGLVTINATLEEEIALELAMDYGVELVVQHERTAEDEVLALFTADEQATEGLKPRPPVITILGHVDHGKTSLLDRIRHANVVATESGGITQHIGAYQIEHAGKKITFVDTPGHEAFTAMRARGANVTDIVVLVVAADDGVMPQTQEAIAHAKAAEVPVVVALNKIDLPNVENAANINKIYGELSQQGLIPEEYGGEVPVVKTSATTGRGIDDLLATLEAVAELHELKADPTRPATGTCLESSKSEGRGVTATILVQSGTLRQGDVIVCGSAFGRVRALQNDLGRSLPEAGPSTPVEVSGLDEVPAAGEKFAVLAEIAQAREVAEARRDRSRGLALNERHTAVTLENIFDQMTQQKLKSLNLILKADVQGSLEALIKELEKLQNPEVPIRVLHKAVGGISESDVVLADASQAIIIGFRVAPEDRAITAADEKKIDIRRYDIIYQVTDEVKKAVEGMLVPETKEVHLGRASVREVFKISKVGAVAGCFVTQGVIERSAKARVIREGREIYKGTLDSLKRFKEDVKEVAQDYECGIKIANYDDLKVDDVIEAYRIDIIRRTL